MKRLMIILLAAQAIGAVAQEKITTLSFLQAGAVPQTINQRGKNISTSGLTFNLANFNENKFFRMDATWLVRYLANGTKDSANFNDSNKIGGLDLPVFTATFGSNFIKGDAFSMGIGLNLDSRTFYSPPSQQKIQKLVDAWNIGFVIGTKIRLKDWITYTGFWGYDFMFTDSKSKLSDGTQIYLQNNVSFLINGKFGINIQPDFSFKSFDSKGFHGAQIFNKNIKLGIAYAIP